MRSVDGHPAGGERGRKRSHGDRSVSSADDVTVAVIAVARTGLVAVGPPYSCVHRKGTKTEAPAGDEFPLGWNRYG